MAEEDWRAVVRVVVTILSVAVAMIPAALAVGLAVRVFMWAAGL